MLQENFNPQIQTATTDIPKERITILRDDEANNELPPGGVKLSGSPVGNEIEEHVLEETTFS